MGLCYCVDFLCIFEEILRCAFKLFRVKQVIKRILVFFAVFLAVQFARPQNPTYYLNPDKKLTQYKFERWTTENGLPTNSLVGICQTKEGYLWITSYNGLIRFDGHQFVVFNKANTVAFTGNIIKDLREDSIGRLWMTSQTDGLISYYKGKFTVCQPENDTLTFCRGLLIDRANRIWSTSPDKGWFYIEKNVVHYLSSPKQLDNIEVSYIEEDANGAIWFATIGQGLFKYDKGILTEYKQHNGLSSEYVYTLFCDNNGVLWIGTDNGLNVYEGKSIIRPANNINSKINNITKDRNGHLWVGTISGLYRQNRINTEFEQISIASGLSDNFVIDFVFDFEGNFWITHYKSGLLRIKDGKFTNYSYSSGLTGKLVNTVCQIDDSTFLAGCENGSITKIQNNACSSFQTKKKLDGSRIRHIFKDSKANIWISTYDGLLKIRPDKSELWYDEKNGFPDSKIRLVFEDSRGIIWVGTRNRGLVAFQNEKITSIFDINSGLTSNLIMAITETPNGNLLIGTSEGKGSLNKLIIESGKVQIIQQPELKSNIIFNFHIDTFGNEWIATNNGVFVCENGKYYNFSTLQGMTDDSPFDILEDDLGNFWMPFRMGIMKVKSDDLYRIIHGSNNQVDCQVFDSHDGMLVSECIPTAKTLKNKNGEFYFATGDGLAVINPLTDKTNNYIPEVIIEEVKTDKEIADISGNVIFDSGIKRYTFKYTALSLYEPSKVKFKYILEGFDNEWVEVQNVRAVSYTNLPNGNYIFKVIACNNDGVWNEKGTELKFTIKPQFTETSFFYILLLIGSFSLVYLFYMWRIAELKKKQNELAQIIKDRTHEVTEKNVVLERQKAEIQAQNDNLNAHKTEIEKQKKELEIQKEELKASIQSKDRIFSIISHDLRSPLGNIRNMLGLMLDKSEQFDASKRKRILENLAEITKSTYYLLDNLLSWSRSQRGLISFDPQLFLVAPLINEILGLVRYQSEKKRITITSLVKDADLAYGDTNMIKTIFRNIIENALKFTHEGGRIEISATLKGDFIEFAICDNGVGISPENLENLMFGDEIITSFGTNREKGSGLGLLLSKEFIRKNNGLFRVESKLAEGSTFYVALKRFQL